MTAELSLLVTCHNVLPEQPKLKKNEKISQQYPFWQLFQIEFLVCANKMGFKFCLAAKVVWN